MSEKEEREEELDCIKLFKMIRGFFAVHTLLVQFSFICYYKRSDIVFGQVLRSLY